MLDENVKALLTDMCAKENSEDLAEDMVALFEDIKKFFIENGDEFIDFDSLSTETKEALYLQIKLLIALLKKMKGVDKTAVMDTISKNIIIVLSKDKEKYKSLLQTQLKQKEEQELKQKFAETTLLELQRKYQLSLTLNKTPNPKLMEEIEEHVKALRSSNHSFAKQIGKPSQKSLLDVQKRTEKGASSFLRK